MAVPSVQQVVRGIIFVVVVAYDSKSKTKQISKKAASMVRKVQENPASV